MSDFERLLVPVTEFSNPQELGGRLLGLVQENRDMLANRNITGPLHRYDRIEKATQSVLTAQQLHKTGTQEIFGIVGEEGDVEGIATIHPTLLLRKLHLPLPPGTEEALRKPRGRLEMLGVAVPWLAKLAAHNMTELSAARPNVAAWTADDQFDLLASAYALLVAKAPLGRPWTVEPMRSSRYVHEAIQGAGLAEVKEGRFDDQESKRHAPPKSQLYARLRGDWLTSRGKLKELKTGRASLTSLLNDSLAGLP